MLYSLHIRNFALIDYLELELGNGLNVLTGETGAGKSIILDAIDIVLGGKINSRLIRQGAKRTIIEATFQPDVIVKHWLKQQEIDLLDDGLITCSREITLYKDGLRSRFRVNGILVNRQLILQLREFLVEITAQGQTIQLMIPESQRRLLDVYGGESLISQRQIVEDFYKICQEAKQALEKRRQSEQQRLQRLDLVTYQLQELETANLDDTEELELLQQERDRLSNVVQLQQLSYQVYQSLYQNDHQSLAVADLLAHTESILTDMTKYDNKIEPILEMVNNAIAQVVEAGHEINSYGESLEADPERLIEVEDRIRILKNICRKYGPTLTEAINFYHKLLIELNELTDNGQSLEELEKTYHLAEQNLITVCAELTQLRQAAATQLEQQLITELKPLAMEKVRFECRITKGIISSSGIDKVEFYFSPNQGEELQSLAISASGGEMSRFLLALKACFSQLENSSNTLIFDEIDTGVSGKVAQAIAQKLHQLSHFHQVLCITHQPLIAAMADVHFRVEKQVIEELTSHRTVVRVTDLNNHHHRRDELALLTGGHSANDAIAFADSILSKATEHRKNN